MYDELIGWVRSFAASENTTVDEAEKLHAVIAALTDLQAQVVQERAKVVAFLHEHSDGVASWASAMANAIERGDHVADTIKGELG